MCESSASWPPAYRTDFREPHLRLVDGAALDGVGTDRVRTAFGMGPA
ncbi:hypothetical protein OG933_44575 [Streptomyces sp. NBC_00016]